MNSDEFEYIFGVFAGHGKDGHLVSKEIKKFFDFTDLIKNSNNLSTFSTVSNQINNSKDFDTKNNGSSVILVHINSEKNYFFKLWR